MAMTKVTFTLINGEKVSEILETEVPITSSEQLAVELEFIKTDGFYPTWNGLVNAKYVAHITYEEVDE